MICEVQPASWVHSYGSLDAHCSCGNALQSLKYFTKIPPFHFFFFFKLLCFNAIDLLQTNAWYRFIVFTSKMILTISHPCMHMMFIYVWIVKLSIYIFKLDAWKFIVTFIHECLNFCIIFFVIGSVVFKNFCIIIYFIF